MEPPSEVDFAAPSKMRDWLNYLRDWSISIQPLQGMGVDISSAGGQGRAIHTSIIPGGKKGSAGGAPAIQRRPFEGYDASDLSDPEDPIYQIGIVLSYLDGALPDGFTIGDIPPYILPLGAVVPDGFGYAFGTIYGELTKDTDSYVTLSRDFAVAIGDTGTYDNPTPPSDPATGYFTFSLIDWFVDESGDSPVLYISNYGYGPVSIYRDWFANPASWLFAFTQYV